MKNKVSGIKLVKKYIKKMGHKTMFFLNKHPNEEESWLMLFFLLITSVVLGVALNILLPLEIHSRIRAYGVIMPMVILSIVLPITLHTIHKAVNRYVNNKYGITVLEMIPEEQLEDDTWLHIAEALINVGEIWNLYHGEESKWYRYPSGRVNFEQAKFGLFHTEYLNGYDISIELTDEEKLDNLEFARLWIIELTKSPLLERLAVLREIRTKEEQKAFANRPKREIEEYLQPLEDFYNYVKKEIARVEMEKERVVKAKIKAEEDIIQARVDVKYEYGLKRLDKLQDVEIPKEYEGTSK